MQRAHVSTIRIGRRYQYVCIDIVGYLWETAVMDTRLKSEQLQIRISAAQKSAIQRAAQRADLDMSTYVLRRVLPPAADRFRNCVEATAGGADASYALAELNRLLSAFNAMELGEAVSDAPAHFSSPFIANYIAAMVEYACARRSVAPPAWTASVTPLPDPVFGSELWGMRLHLLTHSPPPFRRRNIFIDSSLGHQV